MWKHQRETFERSKDEVAFAILFEQRVGKTRVVVETAAHLYARGGIDGLVVLAPNGVHRNWVTDELPRWATFPYTAITWRAAQAGRKSFIATAEAALDVRDALPVLAMNVEAVVTDGAKAYLKRFLTRRRCLLVVDESDVIANPGAKRTKTVLAAARYAPYRRILTGTPVAEGPLDAYAQFKFLDPKILGFDSFYAFKARYARFEESYDPRSGRSFPRLAGYLNTDELARNMAPHSARVTRAEVSDAPPKVYAKRYFALSSAERSAYDSLRSRFVLELREGQVTAANVLARYTRLQQIASNVAVLDPSAALCPACAGEGCDACADLGLVAREDRVVRLGEENPRLEALLSEVRQAPGPSIVWCRFDLDVDDVAGALRAAGRRVVVYDGRVSNADRDRSKALFREGAADDFVSKPSAAGRGLDLSRAETVYFYSHHFSLRLRLQGEDRAEGLEKTTSTAIVDLVAEDTVDERVVNALRAKRRLADSITGDDPAEWI